MADWLVANNMVFLLSRCWFSISIELWIGTYEPTEFIHNQYFKKKKQRKEKEENISTLKQVESYQSLTNIIFNIWFFKF